MSPGLTVNLASPVPPYEQIRQQIADLAAAGVLRPGDRLPTIRMLAADLGVAPGTVARAYKELEAAGVVAAMRRRGTVVTGTAVTGTTATGTAAIPDEGPGSDSLESAVASVVQLARGLGMSDDAVLAMLQRALDRPLHP